MLIYMIEFQLVAKKMSLTLFLLNFYLIPKLKALKKVEVVLFEESGLGARITLINYGLHGWHI